MGSDGAASKTMPLCGMHQLSQPEACSACEKKCLATFCFTVKTHSIRFVFFLQGRLFGAWFGRSPETAGDIPLELSRVLVFADRSPRSPGEVRAGVF